jgi:hypothetical protein
MKDLVYMSVRVCIIPCVQWPSSDHWGISMFSADVHVSPPSERQFHVGISTRI